MQLALDNQNDESQATWAEALEVASYVLTGPGPSQLERTELIRIGLGTARCMLQAGRPEQALEVAAKAETQYQALAQTATDPITVLALRGAILAVKADAHAALGDTETAMDTLAEALLELLSGSETNPLIVKQMVREPLTSLAVLIAQN
jgi:tetratricopeptide (TPR) repeat protein